ncbi:hypothetical protein ACWD8I_24085 [Micromonospora arida]|uniref:hypothetical protein n=1 Tax=Micromonospora arida TaxID=2203715 RepID=UPI0033BA9F55
MNHDPHSLVGFFVTEVGIRQAWPFVTFTSNSGTMTATELRLYIDTTCEVIPPPPFVVGLAAEEPASALSSLLEVLNLTVNAVTVADNGDLVLGFVGGVTLRVSGTSSAWTTHDAWWLGDQRA